MKLHIAVVLVCLLVPLEAAKRADGGSSPAGNAVERISAFVQLVQRSHRLAHNGSALLTSAVSACDASTPLALSRVWDAHGAWLAASLPSLAESGDSAEAIQVSRGWCGIGALPVPGITIDRAASN